MVTTGYDGELTVVGIRDREGDATGRCAVTVFARELVFAVWPTATVPTSGARIVLEPPRAHRSRRLSRADAGMPASGADFSAKAV